MPNLLFEIGTEELPPHQLKPLSEALLEQVKTALTDSKLSYGNTQSFATPRRLAFYIEDLDEQQPNQKIEKRGPSLEKAFDESGKPTPALLGFTKSNQIPLEALETLETSKGRWVIFRTVQTGKETKALLPDIIQHALNHLPIKKPMRWGNHPVPFIRPVHWVVLLYHDQCLPVELFGCTSTAQTYGHRFHCPQALPIKRASDYTRILTQKGQVIPDYTARQQAILAAARSLLAPGQTLLCPNWLLEIITGLVEYPYALKSHFEEKYLTLPKEVLTSVIQTHQRCLPIVDEHGQLTCQFIIISNLKSQDPQIVITGNQKVMQARLADAHFFFKADKQKKLSEYIEGLKQVIYTDSLGTIYARSQRISALAAQILSHIHSKTTHKEESNDIDWVKRASVLCYADLLTQMVQEFPHLNGIMGYYYAIDSGEPQSIALAIRDAYLPKQANDALPNSPLGMVLALAQRLDSLVGLFGIGQPPTGTKDPLGLRRAAIGLLRILMEKKLNLDIKDLLIWAKQQYEQAGCALTQTNTVQESLQFIFERLKSWYAEQGISPQTYAAVSACQPTCALAFDRRIKAVSTFQKLPQANHLAAANKRVLSFLKKLKPKTKPTQIVEALLTEPQEKALYDAVKNYEARTQPLIERQAYQEILCLLAELQPVVDAFFEHILVLTDHLPTQNNRIALLLSLRHLFLAVADISLLADE